MIITIGILEIAGSQRVVFGARAPLWSYEGEIVYENATL